MSDTNENNANAANAANEPGKGLRNFKSTADVENFYRFIYENNLRREAKKIFDIIFERSATKKKKSKKSVQ